MLRIDVKLPLNFTENDIKSKILSVFPVQKEDIKSFELLKLALDLWPGMKIESIGGALRDRVSQYWAALTGRPDRRIEFNTKAELSILGTGGAPLSLTEDDDRDCLYWSVRLALLEKLVAIRPVPLFLEAPGEGWPASRLQLLARAWAHLGQTTQVLHVAPSGWPAAAGMISL